jgi:hypothetical protein
MRDDDVGRLDVEMQDIVGVHVREGGGKMHSHPEGVRHAQPALVADETAQCGTFEELHQHVCRVPRTKQSNNVGVCKLCQNTGLVFGVGFGRVKLAGHWAPCVMVPHDVDR